MIGNLLYVYITINIYNLLVLALIICDRYRAPLSQRDYVDRISVSPWGHVERFLVSARGMEGPMLENRFVFQLSICTKKQIVENNNVFQHQRAYGKLV